ncbi:MAG: type II toxin-antitoxin system RelE/ParE family toxin [Rubrivivax sp.]
MASKVTVRVFKTGRFSKDARKAGLYDAELCAAMRQVMAGQADDLGGGVFKKRLNDNLHRSIILAKGGRHWVYEYLFAKKDRANIDDDELAGFRLLAKAYADLTEPQVKQLIAARQFVEICHDHQA